MERADSKKISNPGHESHGVLLCHRCGWPFPNAHPSARYRRAHKRMCGTIEGYTVAADSEATATLSHIHSQHSAVSSFSDDEHGSDGDSKAPSAKGVISTSVNDGGSGRVLRRMNMSSDDVFADAVSEFADTNASLESKEGLGITKKTTIAQDAVGIRSFSPPVEETSVTGSFPESVNHENLKSEGPQEGSVTSQDPEKVVSFSEIPAKSETMTDANEENKRANAFEDPAGLETGFTEIDDVSEVNAGVVIAPVIEESKTSEAVAEGRTNVELSVAKSEISQSEETHDVKSGSEIVVDDQSHGGKTIICSSDEISEVKVDDNIPRSKGSAGTSPRISENNEVVGVPLLVTNEVVDSSCEIERYISCSLSVDDIGALPIAAVNETLETSSTLTTSGHESEETNEKYLDCLTRASANAGAGAMSTTDKNGQMVLIGGSDINDPEDGFENRGTVAEAGRKVPENEMKSDNMYDDNGSEAHASMLHVVSVTDTHQNTDTEPFDDIGTGNAERFVPKDFSLNEDASLVQSIGTTSETAHQLDSGVESLHAEGAVQVASDVISLDDESIGNSIKISNEVKLDQAEASDPVTDPKPVSHDILLQKLEEDLSDDEPVECSPATESSSQSLGNNHADDGGVACKDAASSKDLAQSQEFVAVPEKGATVTVADVPYDISSPNGSSLDGNWGSVSVLSTMSDATAADVKKMKDAQEEQSRDKSDFFDPPSFQTLVEPQAEKETAVSSKSGEVRNPQKQTDAAKAAWFPSITNVANDSHGRKKNEEIIAKVTNWSTGKQHLPLKTLLGEAKANSPNTNTPAVPKANSPDSPGKNKTPVTTVNSIMGAEESELPKDKLESSAKEWSSSARYPDEIKREKRKVKSKPYWVPFMCCSSSVK
ncbi:unnamed protein product [Rhodiola kirilowii]